MSTVSTSFTAVGTSELFFLKRGQSATYDVSGTFVGTIIIDKTLNGGATFESPITTLTVPGTAVVVHGISENANARYRIRCTAFTSGTIVTSFTDAADDVEGSELTDGDGLEVFKAVDGGVEMGGTMTVDGASTLTGAVAVAGVLTPAAGITRISQKKIITAGAKAGGTAGFLIDATNDKNSLAKCPASKTAATLVVKIPDLKVGDVITGFGVSGQLESAGNTVTLDAALRAQTAVAGDNTDASIGTITQISKTADYLIADEKTGLSETVTAGKSYYILLTATTDTSNDIDLLSVDVTVTEK